MHAQVESRSDQRAQLVGGLLYRRRPSEHADFRPNREVEEVPDASSEGGKDFVRHMLWQWPSIPG